MLAWTVVSLGHQNLCDIDWLIISAGSFPCFHLVVVDSIFGSMWSQVAELLIASSYPYRSGITELISVGLPPFAYPTD